jgi:hypothetical protein
MYIILFRKFPQIDLIQYTRCRRATCHTLIGVANCINVDGTIFETVILEEPRQLSHLNNKNRY